MTPEEYWAYKAFVRDDAAQEALESSEIFKSYAMAERVHEAELFKINAEIQAKEKEAALKIIDDLESKLAASPKLKNKLREVKAYLDKNPEMQTKVDQNFILGLSLLNLED